MDHWCLNVYSPIDPILERLCNKTALLQIPDERKVSADGLTVRVINNITKKLDVKQKFLETFRNEGYPEQLQYKQKVTIKLLMYGIRLPASHVPDLQSALRRAYVRSTPRICSTRHKLGE